MRLFSIIFLLLLSVSFVTPLSANAGCQCWCGTSQTGALSFGDQATKQACSSFCPSINQEFLSCVDPSRPSDSPAGNLKCWTQAECEKQDANGNVTGTFGKDQPADCQPNFHYCLSTPQPIQLGVHLGDKAFVYSFGGYIVTMFRWLLGAGTVIAIIMVMVGGIQFMLAGGGAGVKEAKSRIYNAIIGVVLLLSVYFLLQVVNPQTLRLTLPPIPKMRMVLLPDNLTSCEEYHAAGYRVEVGGRPSYSGTGTCGTKGTVTKGPNSVSLTEEPTCVFRGCASGTLCRVNVETNEGSCQSCVQLIGAGGRGTVNDSLTPQPSSGLCRSIPPQTQGEQVTWCRYLPEHSGLSTAFAVAAATCAEYQIDCSQGGANRTCDTYNTIQVRSGSGSVGPTLTPVADVSRSRRDETNFREICERDPCEYGRPRGACELIEPSPNVWNCRQKE